MKGEACGLLQSSKQVAVAEYSTPRRFMFGYRNKPGLRVLSPSHQTGQVEKPVLLMRQPHGQPQSTVQTIGTSRSLPRDIAGRAMIDASTNDQL